MEETLDKKIKIKCMNAKKNKLRTYIYGLDKFYEKEDREKIAKLLKKALGTSILCESAAEMGDSGKKKGERNKKAKDIDDPVYSVGGDLIDKVCKFFITKEVVEENQIYRP